MAGPQLALDFALPAPAPSVPSGWHPSPAWPAELAQATMHYASGVNDPGEVEGLVMSGRRLGVTATELSEPLLAALEWFADLCTELLVDSGAFSEVAWSPERGRFVVARPIDDAAWLARLELYATIAAWYGRRVRLVAPDFVGDQDATLDRLARYAVHVAACAALGAQIIVPVQKGALPMSEMFRRCVELPGLRQCPIAGVPMKKDATSLADLAELVASLPWYGARLHLLGIGPESRRFEAVIRTIRAIRPNAEITSDSVTIRRLVGRTNGRGGGPRALTRYQDEARERGLQGPAIKAFALGRQGMDERDADLDRAIAGGWFDAELYDSPEEARADLDRIRAELSLETETTTTNSKETAA